MLLSVLKAPSCWINWPRTCHWLTNKVHLPEEELDPEGRFSLPFSVLVKIFTLQGLGVNHWLIFFFSRLDAWCFTCSYHSSVSLIFSWGSYALIAEIRIISEADDEKSVFVGKLHLTSLYSVRQWGITQKYWSGVVKHLHPPKYFYPCY